MAKKFDLIDAQVHTWKERRKREAGAVEKLDTRVINIWVKLNSIPPSWVFVPMIAP